MFQDGKPCPKHHIGDSGHFDKMHTDSPISVDVQSITTQGVQKLYLTEEDVALMKGKRVLLVDDVISTGASLSALEKLAEKAGGIICGRVAVLAEGDAADRKDLIFLERLPLFDKAGNAL